MSNPPISYLSSTNDENRSGVWGKGHKRETAENLPEYEEEAKTTNHMCTGYSMTLAGEREVPKKWNFHGSLLQNPDFYTQNLCVFKILYERT